MIISDPPTSTEAEVLIAALEKDYDVRVLGSKVMEIRAVHHSEFPEYSPPRFDNGRKYGKQYRRDIHRGNR